MVSTAENNKRIAKNTAMLCIRMLLIMAVTLYTSRVVLEVLGVEDFGIYNVVGGVVTMLGFINSSLSGATSRFITFELGRGKDGDLKKVFRCAVSVHYLLALVILFLGETVGLWFVLEKMVIPLERMNAALWVYQCSIVTIIVSIISAPYNALIIAHERMSAFAYISIAEAIAKLLIVFLLMQIHYDKLIVYALLLVAIQISIRFLYTIYCNRHFPESSAYYLWDKDLSRRIFVYAGWTMNGNLAVVGYTQGLNILLNLFFGPAVNAARGIAVQVQGAVQYFFVNFQMAVRPQIIKSYASGDLDYMHKLIIESSKYSFYLMLLVSMPILVNTEYILHLWLGIVPEHAVAFTRLMLFACMNYALSNPTLMAIHATGDLKRFQIIEGTLLLTVVPVAYLFLKLGNISAEYVFVIYLVIETITQFVRVWIVYPRVKLAKKRYLREILYPIFKVLMPLLFVGYWLSIGLPYTLMTFVISTCLCILSCLIFVYLLGMSSHERNYVLVKINGLVNNGK